MERGSSELRSDGGQAVNTQQIKDALFDFALGALPGVTIIHAEQKGEDQASPLPEDPFCSIRLGADNAIGTDEQVMEDQAGVGVMELKAQRQITVQFRLWSDNARDLASQLRQAFHRPSLCETLELAGLAFVREAGTIDRTDLGAFYDGRAQVDVVFGYTGTYQDDPGWIEDFDFAGELEGGATGTITVEWDYGPAIGTAGFDPAGFEAEGFE